MRFFCKTRPTLARYRNGLLATVIAVAGGMAFSVVQSQARKKTGLFQPNGQQCAQSAAVEGVSRGDLLRAARALALRIDSPDSLSCEIAMSGRIFGQTIEGQGGYIQVRTKEGWTHRLELLVENNGSQAWFKRVLEGGKIHQIEKLPDATFGKTIPVLPNSNSQGHTEALPGEAAELDHLVRWQTLGELLYKLASAMHEADVSYCGDRNSPNLTKLRGYLSINYAAPDSMRSAPHNEVCSVEIVVGKNGLPTAITYLIEDKAGENSEIAIVFRNWRTFGQYSEHTKQSSQPPQFRPSETRS